MEPIPTALRWAFAILGSGALGVLWAAIAKYFNLWTNARTEFQDNLLSRVHNLEGRLEHLRSDQQDLKDKVRSLQTENAQLRNLLRRLHEENNELRRELGRDPVPIEELDTSLSVSIAPHDSD